MVANTPCAGGVKRAMEGPQKCCRYGAAPHTFRTGKARKVLEDMHNCVYSDLTSTVYAVLHVSTVDKPTPHP